jgi:hypothetical protein
VGKYAKKISASGTVKRQTNRFVYLESTEQHSTESDFILSLLDTSSIDLMEEAGTLHVFCPFLQSSFFFRI